MLTEHNSILLVDGCHGIYVPQTFAERCMVTEAEAEKRLSVHPDARLWKGYDDADVAALRAGPPDGLGSSEDSSPHYWEIWDDVLSNAYYDHADGRRYFLYQDGDLFAVCDSEGATE